MDGCNTSFYLSYFYRHHGVSPYYGDLLASGDDAGIVQNQNVADTKEFWKIRKMMMGRLARGAVGDQKPRAIAGRGRVLGD